MLTSLEAFTSEESATVGGLILLFLLSLSTYSQDILLIDFSQPIIFIFRNGHISKPDTIRLSALSICSTCLVFQLALAPGFPPLWILALLASTFCPAILSLVSFLLAVVASTGEFLQ